MRRTENPSSVDPTDASRIDASTLKSTRAVEPVDYDLTEVAEFEAMIKRTLQKLLSSNAVDGETLRALDAHIAAGQRELELGLDVQRSHHKSITQVIATVAHSNVVSAQQGLDRAQRALDRAEAQRAHLEEKLGRHDPEGHSHV